MTIKHIQVETASDDSDSKPLLKAIDEVEDKFDKLAKALFELKTSTLQLPAAFRRMYKGRVNNLDTPKEYQIWVTVENFKEARLSIVSW